MEGLSPIPRSTYVARRPVGRPRLPVGRPPRPLPGARVDAL